MKKNIIKLMTAVFAMAATAITTVVAPVSTIEVEAATLSSSDQSLFRGLFDATYYAKTNPDVVRSYGSGADKLYEHFINFGIYEGRQPSADFNVFAYASAYNDLRNSFGTDIPAYYRHYQNYGKSEGRKVTTIAAATAAGKTVTNFNTGAVISNARTTTFDPTAAKINAFKAEKSNELMGYYVIGAYDALFGSKGEKAVNASVDTDDVVYTTSTATLRGYAWKAKGEAATASSITIILFDNSNNAVGTVTGNFNGLGFYVFNGQPDTTFCSGNPFDVKTRAMAIYHTPDGNFYDYVTIKVQ